MYKLIIGLLGVFLLIGCTTSENYDNIVVPKGMVLIPNGTTYIGNDEGLDNEKSGYKVKIKAFLMDVHPVTVSQFREFVEATKFKNTSRGIWRCVRFE